MVSQQRLLFNLHLTTPTNGEEMAEERPKRANAGSKIGSLVNQELKDDFYSTAYGGFEEDSNDDEYEVNFVFALSNCIGQTIVLQLTWKLI